MNDNSSSDIKPVIKVKDSKQILNRRIKITNSFLFLSSVIYIISAIYVGVGAYDLFNYTYDGIVYAIPYVIYGILALILFFYFNKRLYSAWIFAVVQIILFTIASIVNIVITRYIGGIPIQLVLIILWAIALFYIKNCFIKTKLSRKEITLIALGCLITCIFTIILSNQLISNVYGF